MLKIAVDCNVWIASTALFVDLKKIPPTSRDSKDDMYLVCLEAIRDYLVTGDRDLLDLDEFTREEIITPAQFIEILSSRTTNQS